MKKIDNFLNEFKKLGYATTCVDNKIYARDYERVIEVDLVNGFAKSSESKNDGNFDASEIRLISAIFDHLEIF